MNLKHRLTRHWFLFLLAISIGVCITLADRVIFYKTLNRPIEVDEPDVLIVNALLTALPFLMLSARSKQHITSWIAGIIPSVGLAWWWLQKGINYQRSPDGSGVDLGGAMIMLFAPFAITGICLVIDQWLREKGSSGG